MKRTRLATLLLAVAFAALTAQSALAAGTAACTTISNVATLTYNVGGNPTTLNSLAEEFKVDNIVNLEVVTTDIVTTVTAPHGGTNMVLTFTVTNTGNMKQDYALSPAYVAGGTTFGGSMTDEFDAGAATAYVESGDTPGYDNLDTATYIDGLSPTDPAKVVYVVIDGPVPTTTSDGDNSVYRLVVTTHEGDTDGAYGAASSEGTPGATCGEDIVFADTTATPDATDGVEDGKGSDFSGLTVTATAILTVTKTSAIYSDPINGTTSPKAIPGAIVTYTITILNPVGSSATATGVTIADSLDAEITALPSRLAFNTQFGDGIDTCAADKGIVVNNDCLTNNVDVDAADFTANVVNVAGSDLAPGASTEIKFQVTIQ